MLPRRVGQARRLLEWSARLSTGHTVCFRRASYQCADMCVWRKARQPERAARRAAPQERGQGKRKPRGRCPRGMQAAPRALPRAQHARATPVHVKVQPRSHELWLRPGQCNYAILA